MCCVIWGLKCVVSPVTEMCCVIWGLKCVICDWKVLCHLGLKCVVSSVTEMCCVIWGLKCVICDWKVLCHLGLKCVVSSVTEMCCVIWEWNVLCHLWLKCVVSFVPEVLPVVDWSIEMKYSNKESYITPLFVIFVMRILTGWFDEEVLIVYLRDWVSEWVSENVRNFGTETSRLYLNIDGKIILK